MPEDIPSDWLMKASLDDLQAIHAAEAALVDPVDAEFYEIAHRLEHSDDHEPEPEDDDGTSSD